MENGIYKTLSIKDYHDNRTHISATSIKEAKKSLRHFDWHRREVMPRERKIQWDFGNGFELALLDKTGFEKEVAIRNELYWIDLANQENIKKEGKPYSNPRNTNIYKHHEQEFLKLNSSKYHVNDSDYERIEAMLESCYKDSTINKLIEGTEYQLSLFWTDEETGLKLKTRPDICKRKKNVIVNLKTIVDGSPKSFSKDLAKWDYPLQACVEISGCINSGLMPSVDNYFWLVVEKEPPFNATIYEFIESDIRSTMMEYEYLVNIISKAEKENNWPGYTQQADNKHGILQARIPLWYKENL